MRQSVANYFVDPSGVSKSPKAAGGIMQNPAPGSIPEEHAVRSGGGIRSPSGEKTPSPATAAVAEWIRSDPTRFRHWCAQAKRCREEAKALATASNQSRTPEKIATQQLSQLLASELDGNIPKDLASVYHRMLIESLKGVNWEQVAEDIMAA